MKRRANIAKRVSAVIALCSLAALTSLAQTLTTLASFDQATGYNPSGLVQAINGDLYGTTEIFGPHGGGTVFKITPSGALTTLYGFHSSGGGSFLYAGLVQATNGDLYGTTYRGGANGAGTVFKITPSGALTTLYTFCSVLNCADGENPVAGLVKAVNGNLYGTTQYGGTQGAGTIFKITPSGTLTTLYSFCSLGVFPNCADGQLPITDLVQATNGDLYGTTAGGAGAYCTQVGGCGTIFKITLSGTLTTIYNFCSQANCADGEDPYAGLVQATNGNLYGTTYQGGTNNAGTIFEITPSGALTTLYSFCSLPNCADGEWLYAGLVQATDGDLYGATFGGGTSNGCGFAGCGTIFRITPSGALTTLYSFCSQAHCADGAYTYTAPIQATTGDLYGATGGTIYRLSLGLSPFVESLPTAAKIGTAVKILGTGLTGATRVTFNGTVAVFRVASPSLIITAVPTGATTGTIKVVTPGGTLSSSEAFHVLP